MLGYSVTKADGTVQNIEADRYEVKSDGTLMLYDDGHYVHGLKDPGLFSDWRLDFSSLTERLLAAAELSSTDGECRAEATDVRLAIAKHFGLNR